MASLTHGMNCAAHSLIHGPKSASYSVLAADPGDLAAARRVGHDDQPLALAEAGRRCPLGEPGDALDDRAVDAALLEPADRPAAASRRPANSIVDLRSVAGLVASAAPIMRPGDARRSHARAHDASRFDALLRPSWPSSWPAVQAPPASPSPSATPVPSPTPSASPRPSVDSSGALDARIDVGDGRHIHVLCRGEPRPGVPILWLENGLDGSLHNWAAVRGPLQQLTRVCGCGPGRASATATARRPRNARSTISSTTSRRPWPAPASRGRSSSPRTPRVRGCSTVFAARHPDGRRRPRVRGPARPARLGRAPGGPRRARRGRGPRSSARFATTSCPVASTTTPSTCRFAPSEATGRRAPRRRWALLRRPAADRAQRRAATIDAFPDLPDALLARRGGTSGSPSSGAYADGVDRRRRSSSVPGSAHLMMDDRPRAVIDAIAAVLEDTSTP